MGRIVRGMLQPGAYEEESENRRYRCPRGAFPLRDDFGQGKSNRIWRRLKRQSALKNKRALCSRYIGGGKGTRFSGERWGKQNFTQKIDQKPMYMHMMDKMQAFSSVELFIVTGDEKIIEEAEKEESLLEK